MQAINLEIVGLGVILYSPFAVTHIGERTDYLQEHFTKPEDIARHVMECELTSFCTGSPGMFRLRFLDGAPTAEEVQAAEFKLRLGLEVRGGKVCVRDLYDLMDWFPECPTPQQVRVSDGWYLLTVYSSRPPGGILGDRQVVSIFMESVDSKPALRWEGVPHLC